MTIEAHIARHATLTPTKPAIICDGQAMSYAALNSLIDQCAHDMAAKGLKPGDIVCLRATPTPRFLAEYFALHRLGCVAAPMERDMPEETFNRLQQWLTACTVPEGSADILYTTGTTGQQKGVIISHTTICSNAENLIGGQGFTDKLIFIVNGPLNHIGSLSKVYPVFMLGATLAIVDGLRNQQAFFDAFRQPLADLCLPEDTKYATFLVPASIRMLLAMASDNIAALADSIDFIETGAAAISQSDMQALCRLLPKSRLYNTYASTETGIISTYNFNDGLCQAGCLGRPMRHSRIIITPEGTIACQGATLMTGYAGDDERTRSVMRDGTLYTADIGRLDSEGMLHLTGRQDDVINVGGFKVAPTEVEDAAMAHPDITDCICTAMPHKITGQALKLYVVLRQGCVLDRRSIARFIATRLEAYKVPAAYEQTDHIERTFNGKPNRKYYKATEI